MNEWWRINKDEWSMNNEQGSMIIEEWTMKNETVSMFNKEWTRINDLWRIKDE